MKQDRVILSNLKKLLLVFSAVIFAAALCFAFQGPSSMRVGIGSISILPPDPIPHGTCKGSSVGYIGDPRTDRITNITPGEIGSFAATKLKSGYIVTMYPQPNGSVFEQITCATEYPTAPSHR